MSKNFILITLFFLFFPLFQSISEQSRSQKAKLVNVGTNRITEFKTELNYNGYYLASYGSPSKVEYQIKSDKKLEDFQFLFSDIEYNVEDLDDPTFTDVTNYKEEYKEEKFIYSIIINNNTGKNSRAIYLYVKTDNSQFNLIVDIKAGLSVLLIVLIMTGAMIIVYIGAIIIALCLGHSFMDSLCICCVCFGCRGEQVTQGTETKEGE